MGITAYNAKKTLGNDMNCWIILFLLMCCGNCPDQKKCSPHKQTIGCKGFETERRMVKDCGNDFPEYSRSNTCGCECDK